jgi:competence protein ComEC
MMRSNYPIVRVLIPFIIGILCQKYGHLSSIILIVISVIGICFLLPNYFFNLVQKYTFGWLNGIGIHCIIFVIAYFIAAQQDIKNQPNHYGKHIEDATYFIGIVEKNLERKAKSFKATVSLEQIEKQKKLISAGGDIIIYFTKSDEIPDVLPGDRIAFAANEMAINNNNNPGEFNYKAFAKTKGISHIIFSSPDQYKILNRNNFTFTSFFARQQKKVLNILALYIKDPAALGTAEALLVGERSNIDKETWSSYSKAGIAHIIAISGMHISLIYQAIFLIFSWNKKKRKMIKPAIVVALIGMWLFAFLTGMPASITRAAVMLSFIAVSQLFDMQNKTYNVLALSSLCLLFLKTDYLFDVGFQLSYTALFGILLFNKPMDAMRPSNNIALKYVWGLTSTCIAAQIFTLPLCLYYFHQIPLLFIPANLIAIPVTGVCLALEVVMLLLHFVFPAGAAVLGTLTNSILTWNNGFISWISNLSFVQIKQVHITELQMILFLLLICLISIAWFKKEKWSLLASSICLILFGSSLLQERYQNLTAKEIIVFHVPKGSYGVFIHENKAKEFLQSEFRADLQERYIDPMITDFQLDRIDTSAYFFQDSNFVLNNIHDQIFCQAFNQKRLAIPNCDYLILSNNAKLDLSELKGLNIKPTIIIDGSNSLWKIKQWKTQAQDLPLQLHITAENGAWRKRLLSKK